MTTGRRFTVFDNGAETAFWVSPEAIADLTTETITRKEDTDAVLACADGTLRVCAAGAPAMLLPTSAAVSAAAAAGAAAASATMAGSNSSGSAGPTGALSCVETHATPLAVELLAAGSALSPDVATSVTAPRWKHLVWGSDGGSAGSALADSTVMRRGWALANAGPHRGGGVTALYAGTDVTGDGVADVVIGRDDGALQVFSAEPGGGTSSAPVMTFAHNAGESIRSLGGGNIGSVDHAELVFQSYGGRVVSLTTESTSARDADDRYGRSRATVQKEARVTMLRAELAELEAKTSAALEELTSEAAGSGVDIGDLGLGPGARPGAQGGLAGGDAAVKARGAVDALRRQLGASATVAEAAAGAQAAQLAKAFDVTTTFTLDAQTAAYRLTVEAPVLIDSVILEADVAIDVLDLNATGALSNADQIGGGSADASAAIVSVTPCDYAATLPGSTGRATSEVLPRVLATYRCQEPSSRVELHLRSVEGQAGDVRLIVVSQPDAASDPGSGSGSGGVTLTRADETFGTGSAAAASSMTSSATSAACATAQTASVTLCPLSHHARLSGGRAEAESVAAGTWQAFVKSGAILLRNRRQRAGAGSAGGDADGLAADGSADVDGRGSAAYAEGADADRDGGVMGKGPLRETAGSGPRGSLGGYDGGDDVELDDDGVPLARGATATATATATGAGSRDSLAAGAAPALSRLVVTGDFSVAQAHSWVVSALPDCPARPALPVSADGPSGQAATSAGRCELAFRSALLGGVLVAAYGDGEAVFESDAVSTLAIMKEVVVADASRLGTSVSTRFHAGPRALERSLALIRAPLERALGLTRRAELYDAVKETTQNETDLAFLSPELRDVLDNGETYRREVRGRPRLLALLFGIVTDAFLDWHRFAGRDVTSSVPRLAELLQTYEYDAVSAFILGGGA